MRKSDCLNVALAALACIAGHAFPVATLLGSYAVLGPAHYLTEMSWLHDHDYFLDKKLSWCAMALVGLTCVFLFSGGHPLGIAALIGAVSLAVAAAFGLSMSRTLLLAAVSGVVAFLASSAQVAVILAAAVLIPTVVHVFGFTAAFVVRGARRQGGSAWSSPLALAAAALSFAVIPCAALTSGPWLHRAQSTFGRPAAYLAHVPGHPTLASVVGFLGFAYAFHYLNWFGKTSAVGWHRIGCDRAILLLVAWAMISLAYMHSLELGLAVSLPFSVGHVFLEFPLNARTFSSFVRSSTVKA